MKDYTYEFDHYMSRNYCCNIYYMTLLIHGYTFLNQYVRQDIDKFIISNDFLTKILSDSLEEGEYVEEHDNIFILRLKKVTDEIVDYVKLLLKYTLILYCDFKVGENNTITWRRIYDSENN